MFISALEQLTLPNSVIVADFSAIEARVIAWFAGEKWRMDVFNSHGRYMKQHLRCLEFEKKFIRAAS